MVSVVMGHKLNSSKFMGFAILINVAVAVSGCGFEPKGGEGVCSSNIEYLREIYLSRNSTKLNEYLKIDADSLSAKITLFLEDENEENESNYRLKLTLINKGIYPQVFIIPLPSDRADVSVVKKDGDQVLVDLSYVSEIFRSPNLAKIEPGKKLDIGLMSLAIEDGREVIVSFSLLYPSEVSFYGKNHSSVIFSRVFDLHAKFDVNTVANSGVEKWDTDCD